MRPLMTGLAIVASLVSLPAAAQPPGLFSELPAATGVVLPRQALAGMSRAVGINRDELSNERFFVSLPGGVSFEAVRDLQEDHAGGSSWIGHASDDANSTIVLGISGDAVAGTFHYQGKMYKLEPRADGRHVLSEVNISDPAPELDPIPVARQDTTTTPVDADTNGSVIDVLVAYTPAVQALYGGVEGASALVVLAVAEANQAYANSGMTTRMKLVRSILTDYVESGSMSTDLSRLSGTNDGFMDALPLVRDAYGADVVSLIENEPKNCGLAYRMATLSTDFAHYAYSVVHHGCATGYFSFAHEIGHNQGAHHDIANATGLAIYPDAHGYQEPNNAFRTVMAYACVGGCVRIGYFSSADILYNGIPAGVVGVAENAKVIDRTAATVADFRASATQLPPGC